MQAKLRAIGNSVGVIIPASELRAVDAKAGDMVELAIKRVLRGTRAGWDNPSLWEGSDDRIGQEMNRMANMAIVNFGSWEYP